MGRSERERWLKEFSAWAGDQLDIRAVIMVGSCARKNHPADEWSDVDLILITTGPCRYLSGPDWFVELGKPLFHIVERTETGELIERRVLFENGLDVDFLVATVESIRQGFPGTFIPAVMQRGWKVLLDKDGLIASIPIAQTADGMAHTPAVPTIQAFEEVVNDFWFHAAWCAKKLHRGELWKATICCNAYLKGLLLRMIEWHALATGEQGLDTWYDGRFLEQWASPVVLKELAKSFAHYNPEDIDGALLAGMGLFHTLAAETARRFQLPYPADHAEKVMDWILDWRSAKTI